jgi:hypothetical protein
MSDWNIISKKILFLGKILHCGDPKKLEFFFKSVKFEKKIIAKILKKNSPKFRNQKN